MYLHYLLKFRFATLSIAYPYTICYKKYGYRHTPYFLSFQRFFSKARWECSFDRPTIDCTCSPSKWHS